MGDEGREWSGRESEALGQKFISIDPKGTQWVDCTERNKFSVASLLGMI